MGYKSHNRGDCMKKFACIFFVIFVTGCTSVKYNGGVSYINKIDHPKIGKIVTAYVGDCIVEKAELFEEEVLVVNNTIDGLLYDIPAKEYRQIGFDQKNDYYSSDGVLDNFFNNTDQALSLEKKDNAKLCIVSVYGLSPCYRGEYERKKKLSERKSGFHQTLIYGGRVGSKINIGYREFGNNSGRPAFNKDVKYDLTNSNTIGYRGARIEVIEANNNTITYKVLQNFN